MKGSVRTTIKNLPVRVFGWRALLVHGDPTLFDRWLWCRRHLQRGPVRTLDAGSGTGNISVYAIKAGNDVTPLSYDDDWNERGRVRAEIAGVEGFEPIVRDLRELDAYASDLGLFDQTICLEVIEHIQDDGKLVNDLASLLKPGGRLLLSTPSAKHSPLVDERLTAVEDGGHVHFGYSREQLESLFATAGLEVQSVEYVSGFFSQQITNAMRLMRRLNYELAWVLTFPLRVLQVLDPVVTRLLRWPYLSIAVVGVKRR